ncbi:MAG: diguanylate cyclase [Planctomycetota bacterium]
MKLWTPVTRIALGLSCVSVSLLLTGVTLGLVPDERSAAMAKRVSLAEALAVDFSLFAGQGRLDSIKTSLGELVKRDPDLLQARLRRTDGIVKLEVPSQPQAETASSGKFQVSVPILAGKRRWGAVEFDYRPLGRDGVLGFVTHPVSILMSFCGSASFVAFYFYLRKTLQYLDPSKVMPTRVRQTLDTIAGGLMVVDNKERIVHTNEAFSRLTGKPDDALRGQRASKLPWEAAEENEGDAYPWTKAIQYGVFETGVRLTLEVKGVGKRTFLTNTSSILDDKGQTRGALVSFDDVTALEASRIEQRKILHKLKQSRDEIQRQNQELEKIATLDPLTSCLNRRALYTEFEKQWNTTSCFRDTLSVFMIDIDHFKSINDNHGHSVGDTVLQHVANMIKSAVRDCDVVCRYGGEEFAILVPQSDIATATELAERCRAAIEGHECEGITVTASLGVSSREFGASDPHRLLDQADEALYAAKEGGRNRVVRWDEVPETPCSATDEPGSRSKEAHDESTSEHISFPAVSALVSAMSFRDPETAEHSRRVSDLCMLVAKELMPPSEAYILETAALLHDIGKIGIPDVVLRKPGLLNDEEWDIMRRHDEIGVKIVEDALGSEQLTELIGAHHAWFGAKRGDEPVVAGEDVPIGARILAIAEAFDTMVFGSVYRPAMTREAAFAELRACAGTQFDPQLVERFISEVSDRDVIRVSSDGRGTREMVFSVASSAEVLASALEKHDTAAVVTVAKRLQQTAQSYDAADLRRLAEQVEELAVEDEDVLALATTADELVDLCRKTQRDYVIARQSSGTATKHPSNN